MKSTPPAIRAAALGVAAVVATTLFATLAAHMPPDFARAPNDARNGVREGLRSEVAIVPSRIEVVGVRVQEAASESQARNARPPG